MTYLEEYRNKMKELSSAVTGAFMSNDKIKEYSCTAITDGMIYKVYFTDDGIYLETRVRVRTE